MCCNLFIIFPFKRSLLECLNVFYYGIFSNGVCFTLWQETLLVQYCGVGNGSCPAGMYVCVVSVLYLIGLVSVSVCVCSVLCLICLCLIWFVSVLFYVCCDLFCVCSFFCLIYFGSIFVCV